MNLEGIAQGLARTAQQAKVLVDRGVVRPMWPGQALSIVRAVQRWGATSAAGYAYGSAVYPHEEAIVDELGSLTFAEVQQRTNALANALGQAGVHPGDNVAVLCRNHRGFIEATVALSKLGANAVYLNTSFSGPQVADVIARESVAAAIYDEEFRAMFTSGDILRFVAWHDKGGGTEPTLEDLIEVGVKREPDPPEKFGRIVILTSGTTGAPKGASRTSGGGIAAVTSLLSRVPLQPRERVLLLPPLFHSWAFGNFTLGLLFSSTYILRRRFDPESALAAVAEQKVTVMPLVPVMMQRILDLPPAVRRKYDTSSLRLVPVSGSALPGDLATDFMDEFGDIVYNVYGSTEVMWATIATPEDMRAAPGTAGKVPNGTTVRLFDERDQEVAQGKTGRIFVGNEMLFEGYTTGGTKAAIGNLMDSGDVGHFDDAGRLFVDGRSDDMIVSGGENVFPQEVEDLIARQPGVVEVAVVGVPDKEFGQRLKAFIVRRDGAALTEQGIQELVRDNLARFKVPREVVFLDSLPRNATGKILKRELAKG